MILRTCILGLASFLITPPITSANEANLLPVGLARVDVTPKTPIRMTGYANRQNESEGVSQRLFARALAVGEGSDAAVIVTVDVLGVPANITEEIATRLKKKANLQRERFTVCATHTHCGPTVNGNASNLFSTPYPPEQQARIDNNTRDLTDGIEKAAMLALADRKPARLAWAQGSVGFATNRRIVENGKYLKMGDNKNGLVDHSLPIICVTDAAGKVRGVLVNYACHSTTLGGGFNKIHGDWAGMASEILEAKHPGSVALVSIGCAGDANPFPRGTEELARVNGQTVADEVVKLLTGTVKPLTSPPVCKLERFNLPLAPLPTKETWEERARSKGRMAEYAKLILERMARGEAIPSQVPYVVQGWAFGEDLAMVFLAGEVVVDYSLRLKKELDGKRLWVTAYANDVPCYIASKRILPEGGYEVESSMIYYNWPGTLAPEAEDKIIAAAKLMVPNSFVVAAKPAHPKLPAAISPADSLASIRVRPGFNVELVAAEPLVADPIDIAWGADGRLWVVEMADYPLGLDGRGKPGGRIKVLEDTDGDGRYDKATLFLDNVPFPTGVLPWKKGILFTAAPALNYAEDTDGDGKADLVRPLFTGFGEGNQQHRVNGPRYGLDGWVYLANGDSDGLIRSVKTGITAPIRGRDLRVRPDEGEIDPQTGRAQFGRNRDDWGNWFGCSNSRPLWHYILKDQDLRRNSFLTPPNPIREVPEVTGAAPVYPISVTVARFNDFDRANRFTSACGTNIYRDDLFGPSFANNAFICEPVHNLVNRIVMKEDGVTFTGKRAAGEEHAEFFASGDMWCRPTSVHTGPDGALYVVDMYRQVIEHPQWIPADWQKELDLRAGHDKGRIYRIAPAGLARRPVPNLAKMDVRQLVKALDSSNGWQRDIAQQLILWNHKQEAREPLKKMLRECERPVARMQALCTLASVGIDAEDIIRGLADAHPGVRRQAAVIASSHLRDARVLEELVNRSDDADAKVRLEVAAALGYSADAAASSALASMALANEKNEYILASILSSLNARNVGQTLTAALADKRWNTSTGAAAESLFRMSAALGEQASISEGVKAIGPPSDNEPPWKLAALAGLLEGLESRSGPRSDLPHVASWLKRARTVAENEDASVPDRISALRLLTRQGKDAVADLPLFAALLDPRHDPAVQDAAIAALVRLGTREAAGRLIASWKALSPRVRYRVLDALVSREPWADQLLSAVETDKLPAGQIDATARQRLLRSKNAGLKGRAEKLFTSGTDSDRVKLIERYAKELPLHGDVQKGREYFRKTCASCHQLEGVGHAVGPDLMMTTDKPTDWFLTAIFDPNRAIEDRYVEYQATTMDGRQINGILASESSVGITLRGAEGKEQTVLRRDLEALRSTGRSPMPEGLEKDLPPAAVADLLAYFASLRPKKADSR